jgi:hypothetical protein
LPALTPQATDPHNHRVRSAGNCTSGQEAGV